MEEDKAMMVYIDGEYAFTVYGKDIQIVVADSFENRIEVKQWHLIVLSAMDGFSTNTLSWDATNAIIPHRLQMTWWIWG